MYSPTTKACRAPVPIACSPNGPDLPANFTPVEGTCFPSNVYGGSPCTIACSPGYQGSDTANYTCSERGNWIGGPAPSCPCKSLLSSSLKCMYMCVCFAFTIRIHGMSYETVYVRKYERPRPLTRCSGHLPSAQFGPALPHVLASLPLLHRHKLPGHLPCILPGIHNDDLHWNFLFYFESSPCPLCP